MSNNTLGGMPVIKACCRLYFDGQHDRWVLKAPQQAIFLDALSLLILQACDGHCSAQQIARSIASFAEIQRISENDVLGILFDFERRGVLQITMD